MKKISYTNIRREFQEFCTPFAEEKKFCQRQLLLLKNRCHSFNMHMQCSQMKKIQHYLMKGLWPLLENPTLHKI